MSEKIVRSTVLILLAGLILLSVVATPVAAAPIDATEDDDKTEEGNVDATKQLESDEPPEAVAGTNKAAATRVRKAFLKAKKAFHEARPEIQAIKKGDESPVEDVPTFFESEEDGDEGADDDEEFQDGSDPELST